MASYALGVPRQQPQASSSNIGSSQEQQDADLALAYSLAHQEQLHIQNHSQTPLPDSRPALPAAPQGFKDVDVEIAAALAESEFSARQADEFARTSEAVYQAAVSKALEVSLKTVSYDDVLRDIKLWSIDLSAATDDVHTALDKVVRRQDEIAAKLEHAIMSGEERRINKYSWTIEQLPVAESRLRDLGQRLAPVGVAVMRLEDLREDVIATSPPLDEAESKRDEIIGKLFRDMGAAGLRPPSRGSDEAGPSNSSAAQTPMEIRDLVASLIEDAQKLPKMPRRRSDASLQSSSTVDTAAGQTAHGEEDTGGNSLSFASPPTAPLAPVSPVSGIPDLISFPLTPEAPCVPLASSSDLMDDAVVLVSELPLPDTSHELQEAEVAGALSLPQSSDVVEEESRRSSAPSTAGSDRSSGTAGSCTPAASGRRRGSTTTPVPFQLSASRQRPSRSIGAAPATAEPIHRIAAFVSLHYELVKDTGVVSQAVSWKESAKDATTRFESDARLPPSPSNVIAFTAQSPPHLVEYVKAQGGMSTNSLPLRFNATNKWSVMCAAAVAIDSLTIATQELSAWEVTEAAGGKDSAGIECRRLWEYMIKVAVHAGTVTHAHDPLRLAIVKHGLPWDEETIPRLRWAAQHAAAGVMKLALACAEDAERWNS